MKIIISPAKKMVEDKESLLPKDEPIFINEAKELLNYLQSLNFDSAKKLLATNEKITLQNMERFANMNLASSLTPAIFAYDGIQYQYMGVSSLDDDMVEYLQDNLRIISGFYGLLRPLDGVTPYRLEMQAKVQLGNIKGLYDYWGKKIYDTIIDDSHIIINLASKEYSKAVEKYLSTEDKFITCTFAQSEKNKLVQKATYAKMARGYMVRYMAENNVQDIEGIKKFDSMGYSFNEDLSTEDEFVFIQEN
ncbi:hypothetical protein HMPREF0379_0578 [[Eubacterium] yurii subsp. margaretiae ATCC 43715]|nr:hypothetical protein HMPREF0379_0578 [[Eubacterium] yurii subsp. margaretiae ATCC 43715]